MALLEGELNDLGLGNWWRSTFSQEERGYIEWMHFEEKYFDQDARDFIPLEQREQIEYRLAELYKATSLTFFLSNIQGIRLNSEDIFPEELRREMLSPRQLERFERRIIERIESPDSHWQLEQVREKSKQEIERQITERLISNSHSKAEVKHLKDFGIRRLWTLSEEELEQIENQIDDYVAKRCKAAFPAITRDLLLNLADLARKLEDKSIAQCINAKARDFHFIAKDFIDAGDTLALHYWYGQMITIAFADRDLDPIALAETIEACENQIEIAPKAAKEFTSKASRHYIPRPFPDHIGYTRLAIIREQQRDYTEAIRLATEAKYQGWSGDWDKRIERCKTRLQNQDRRASSEARKQKI